MLWGVGQERHLTRTLQGNCQLMLVLGAVSRLPSWLNLCAIRDEATEPVHFLVVDHTALVAAE
jgi:hypothetical protein